MDRHKKVEELNKQYGDLQKESCDKMSKCTRETLSSIVSKIKSTGTPQDAEFIIVAVLSACIIHQGKLIDDINGHPEGYFLKKLPEMIETLEVEGIITKNVQH